MSAAPVCFSLYLGAVQMNFSTYVPSSSPVHALDARVKVVLLSVYAVAAFFVSSWLGLALFAALLAVALLASGVPARSVLLPAAPVYALVLLTVLLNSFVWSSSGLGFVEAGFFRACFFGLRIVLLTWAFLLAGFTTSSTALMEAFAWLLRPLEKLGLPVDDAVMALSVAVRFIPAAAEELFRVHDAQWARGAGFNEGALTSRLKTWASVLLPLVMGMFRHAEALSCAMDARCYGAAEARTSLVSVKLRLLDAFVLAAGAFTCVLIAWIF